MRDNIRFLINGREHVVAGEEIFLTLSNYLRYSINATGTKIVCEEGDCGACTVLMRRSASEEFISVNSCILSLCQLDGAAIITVEGLSMNGALSPVQESMVACHGAQCGYCTPGFVVAIAGLYETCGGVPAKLTEKQVRDGLTGNLCRCTGYEPIIKAAIAVDGASMPKLRDRYRALPDASDGVMIEARGRTFCAPTTLKDAIAFKAQHPKCTIVQGGTDVGVWINKRRFAAPAMLSIAKLPLNELSDDNGTISVGANVTLARFEQFIETRIPELFRILNIFGSPQIKNAGTLAGNVANGSPIGDTLPFLLVAGARLDLAGSDGTRTMPIEDFYLGYKKFDLRDDEIITRIIIPKVDDTLRLYKVSRRKDLDISAFTAAIRLRMNGDTIADARIFYGGVAPVVLRLPKTEAFLRGKVARLDVFESAGAIAAGEVSPISDVRGSRDYRLLLAENIMSKFYYDVIPSPSAALRTGSARELSGGAEA